MQTTTTHNTSLSFFGKENFSALDFSEGQFSLDWQINAGHTIHEHVHNEVDEKFEITKGELRFKMNGKIIIAKAGDEVFIPKGIPHEVKNPGKEPAYCRVSYTPAADQGNFFKVGIFLLEKHPALNGKMNLVLKMVYIAKQVGYKDFSTPGNGLGKAIHSILMGMTNFVAWISGWKKLVDEYASTSSATINNYTIKN